MRDLESILEDDGSKTWQWPEEDGAKLQALVEAEEEEIDENENYG